MRFILFVVLWNYAQAPLDVDETTCREVVFRLATNRSVISEHDDGTMIKIRRAWCLTVPVS